MSPLEYVSYILGAIVALGAIFTAIRRFFGRRKTLPVPSPDIIPLKKQPSWKEVYNGVRRLSQKIEDDYKPDLIVAVSSGGAIVAGMLSKLLNVPVTQICRSSPHSEETKPSDSTTIFLPEVMIKNKKILLVDDTARSGWTLHQYHKEIEEKVSPSGIKPACLLLAGEHWLKKPDYYVYMAKEIDIRMPWDYRAISR